MAFVTVRSLGAETGLEAREAVGVTPYHYQVFGHFVTNPTNRGARLLPAEPILDEATAPLLGEFEIRDAYDPKIHTRSWFRDASPIERYDVSLFIDIAGPNDIDSLLPTGFYRHVYATHRLHDLEDNPMGMSNEIMLQRLHQLDDETGIWKTEAAIITTHDPTKQRGFVNADLLDAIEWPDTRQADTYTSKRDELLASITTIAVQELKELISAEQAVAATDT